MMQRRAILGAAGVAAASFFFCGNQAKASPVVSAQGSLRRLQIEFAHTGSVFTGSYSDGRRYDPAALEDLDQVLADSRTGEMRRFDPRVFDILWEIGQHLGGMTSFTILSGYRSPSTNRLLGGAPDSLHMNAQALDVQMPRSLITSFAAHARAMGQGGVGLYRRHSFVHIDCGNERHWGDGLSQRTIRKALADEG